MTAARFALGAVLAAAVLAAALWALARLPVMCAVIAGAIRTWERTGNRRGRSTR